MSADRERGPLGLSWDFIERMQERTRVRIAEGRPVSDSAMFWWLHMPRRRP